MIGTVVCDLDGVVYVGSEAVEGSADALRRIEEMGFDVVFCTNNSSRTTGAVAEKIRRVTGFPARPEQVVTSAMAATSLIPPGEQTLVLGGDGISEALEAAGIPETTKPSEASWVVVGFDPGLTYERLTRAVLAVNGGAGLVATNHDATYPTPDGLHPGAGSILAAVERATGRAAVVAGKPHAPMRSLLAGRVSGDVWMVGDRPDTDLAMAVEEGWRSVLVTTGVTPPGTSVEPPPDHVLSRLGDLPGLLQS